MAFSIPPTLRTGSGAARTILGVAVPLSVLALGSLHTPVLCAITALLAVAAFVSWYGGTPYRSRLPATVLFYTAIGLTAFTALQALPLPASLVRLLAPTTGDVWARALSPLGEAGPAWTTLSLDPIATRVEVVRGIAYLATFLVALRIADRHGGSTYLSMLVVITSVVLAGASILHPMFGAHRVFGVYQPTADNIASRHIAPLLNPNHLGAYLNIGFCLALGLSLNKRRTRFLPIIIALTLVLAMMQLWVASRGGTLAMIFGAVIVFLTGRMSRRFIVRSSVRIILPTLVIAAGVGMAILGLSSDATNELASLDVSKTKLAMEGLRLLPHHALFGVGRGAFEATFPAVRWTPGYVNFTHPENLVVQWLTEWGLPASVAAGAAILYALRPTVLIASSTPAVGAWAALVTIVIQNLVDFSSEVPAIGIACSICAAMIVTGRGSTRAGRLHSWAMAPRRVAIGIGVAAVASIALALSSTSHELEDDQTALFHDVVLPALPSDFMEEAREAIVRHPSEPYLPFIAAVGASRHGKSVLPWVERTLELSPIYAPAHYILAQQLASISPGQARLEYRLAIAQTSDDRTDGSSLGGASSLIHDFDDALEVIPDGAKRLWTLTALARELRTRLPSTSVRLDEMIRRTDPNDLGPIERTIADTLTDLDEKSAAPWCTERAECTRAGLAAAERLIALQPGSCHPLALRARLLVAADEAPRGLHDLEAASQTTTDATECWRALGDLAASAKSETYVMIAESEISRAGCANDDECANNQLWIAGLEEARGNKRGAIAYYQHALDAEPERTDLLEHLARITSSLGMHAQARTWYQRLAAATGDPSWGAAAEHEKGLLFREGMQIQARAHDGGLDPDLLDSLVGAPPGVVPP